MLLLTGKMLHSYQWGELPIDKDVINVVEKLAQEERQKVSTDKHLMLEQTPGVEILDPDEEHEVVDHVEVEQRINDEGIVLGEEVGVLEEPEEAPTVGASY